MRPLRSLREARLSTRNSQLIPGHILKELTPDELQKAREGIQELAVPARERRGFRRNRKGHLKVAFALYTKNKKSPFIPED